MQPQNHKGRTALLAILFVAACRLPGSAGTYLVDRTEDNATIAGTLRHEIYFNANINPGPDTIIFNVGTSIAVYSQIDVNGQLEIQGSGQTIGAYAKTYPIFNFGNGAAGSTITGIALVDADVGLLLGSNCNGTIVKGCRIGTDWEEVDDRGCNIGIDVRSHYNVIGGPAGDRNIIINNGQYGIRLLHTIIPRQNKIQGNYIGLQSDGMTAVPNDIGIFIQDSLSAWIGGDAASGEGNLISGNTQYGIYCDSADCIGNTIVGNLVGLNAAQSAQVPNQADGIRFNQNCAGNYVGLPGSSQYRN
ncbi:hypothetical protein JW933_11535, partial [candidate division FCPU426 bacterium]|nr:hypothetical protein [candidate division FCPU426 bacterium]